MVGLFEYHLLRVTYSMRQAPNYSKLTISSNYMSPDWTENPHRTFLPWWQCSTLHLPDTRCYLPAWGLLDNSRWENTAKSPPAFIYITGGKSRVENKHKYGCIHWTRREVIQRQINTSTSASGGFVLMMMMMKDCRSVWTRETTSNK